MIKKTGYLLISIGILYAGYIAVVKLQYWERSIRIFAIGDSQYINEGRGGRDFGSSRGFRESHERERDYGNESRGFERGMPGRGGRDHGDFAGGRKVNLRNIYWFLAVFASFTVVAIYIDKAYCLVRKRRVG